MPRRTLVTAGVAALIAVPATASDQLPVPIEEFYQTLEAQMRAGRSTPFGQRFHALAPVIGRVFDLDAILRVSIGLRWSTLDAATRATLADTYRRFTVATYVANFDRYEGEKFEILPDVRSSGADQVVPTHIISSNGETLRLDYLMHHDATGWRVIDVLLQGTISRVAVQRSDFRSLIAQGGASALVTSLQQKIVALSRGALA